MKLSGPKSAFAPVVSSLRGIFSHASRSPNSFSSGYLLFRPTDSGVSVVSTDHELEMVSLLEGVSVDDPKEVLVSAGKLDSIINNSSEEEVISLVCSAEKTEIRAEQSHFNLSSLPADQFPLMDEVEKGGFEINLRADDLRHLLSRVDFAMALNDVRYHLNGMLLVNEKGFLVSVATDGHRLATCRLKHDHEGEKETSVLLPRRAVQELKRTLPKSEENVLIQAGDKQIRVKFATFTLTAKALEGSNYPDYKRVMPDNFTYAVTLESKAFRRTLAQVQIVEGGTVRLSIEGNKLKAVSQVDQDEAEVEQAAQYDGEPFEIGFNPQYLMDVMGAIEAEQLLLEINDSNSAVQIRECDGEAARYIVMPLRL